DFKYMSKWIFAVEVGIVNLLCCLMLLEFVVANAVLYEVACGDEEAVESVVGYRNEVLGLKFRDQSFSMGQLVAILHFKEIHFFFLQRHHSDR
ncbi:hypothetical protein Tco_1358777, partial [Tanacetum coccineum]